ncbi:MAG: NUDIX domain-containing protein [Acidobacteria bacterium]|nr:MAG: NUDIX domain-containing protein [Acidobacteriota bacterium]
MTSSAPARQSAGLLLFRRPADRLEVFLVHPGGPFWARRNLGAWSIPKGEFAAEENAFDAARREFREETGVDVTGSFLPLQTVRQAGGKVVHAWAVEGDCEAASVRSNTFTLEWPPRSGQTREFPEVDRAAWFELPEARQRILASQVPLLDQLEQLTADSRR